MNTPVPDRLLQRVRGEFIEMPGLSLTERQAARLWQVSPGEAEHLLRRLVDARFLVRDRDRYSRLEAV